MRGRVVFGLKLALLLLVLLLQESFTRLWYRAGLEGRLLDAALSFGVAHLVIDLIRLVVIYLYHRRIPTRRRVKNNFSLGVTQIAALLTVFALCLSVLYALHIDLKDAFTSLSIVAAGIAIVSKDYVANVVNGFILMFGNQISIDDYIKIGGTKGTITDITLLNIHLVTDAGELVYIPNTVVLGVEVLNHTKRLERKAYLDLEVPIELVGRFADLEARLQAHLVPYQGQLLEPSHLEVQALHYTHAVLRYYFSFKTADKYRERKLKYRLAREAATWVATHLPSAASPTHP